VFAKVFVDWLGIHFPEVKVVSGEPEEPVCCSCPNADQWAELMDQHVCEMLTVLDRDPKMPRA